MTGLLGGRYRLLGRTLIRRLLLLTELDTALLARLRDRSRQHEHTAVVISGQLVGVEVITEEELPGSGKPPEA